MRSTELNIQRLIVLLDFCFRTTKLSIQRLIVLLDFCLRTTKLSILDADSVARCLFENH